MLALVLSAALAAPIQVALTIDDLPYQTAKGAATVTDPARRAAVSGAMIDALKAAEAPAAIFVNCGNLGEGEGLVAAWSAADFTVGNHTAHHLSLERHPPADWVADAATCHEALAGILGSPPRYFRYPYLRRGQSPEALAAGRAGVEALGEVIAPVTAATSDWLLAQAYDATEDPARRAAIGAAWVEHAVEAVRQAHALAAAAGHPDLPEIALMHVNQLNEEWLDDVLAAYAAAGFEVVSLEAAMKHPAYALTDTLAEKTSVSWLLRLPDPPDVPAARWFHEAERDLWRRFLSDTP